MSPVRPTALPALLLVASLLALAAFATLFHGADLGKFSDDYFLGQRSLRTGEAVRWTAPLESHFFRPLHSQLVTFLQTAFWFDDRANHLVSIVAHAICAWLLYRLLHALGLRRTRAVAFATLFFLYPAPYQVIFWTSALSYGVATSIFLLVCLRCVRLAEGEAGFWSYVGIAALAFLIACFNEQPAAGVVALPALHLASTKQPLGKAIGRACAVGASAVAGVGAYLVPFFASVPEGRRGSVASWISVGEIGGRFSALALESVDHVFAGPFALGALKQGATALSEHPGRTALFLGVGSMLAAAWILVRDRSAVSRESAGDARLSHAWALAFGVSVLACDVLPVYLVRGTPLSSRVLYAPAAALTIILAVAYDRLALAAARRPVTRDVLKWSGRLAFVLAGAAGAIALVGIQGLFLARSRADARLAEALVQALPVPAPGTVFVVVRSPNRVAATGVSSFDFALPSPLEYPQSATTFVRWAYRRPDLLATKPFGRPEPRVLGGSDAGLSLTFPEPAFRPAGARLDRKTLALTIPWSSVVPVVVRENGNVILIRDVVASRGGKRERFVAPQVPPRASGAEAMKVELLDP